MVQADYKPQQAFDPYAQGAPVAVPLAPGQPSGPVPVLVQSPSMTYQPQTQPVVVTMPAGPVPSIGYPGYRTMPPKVPPQPGQVIVAWEIEDSKAGCCKCDTLSDTGWIIIIVLVLIFAPLAPIVCCIASMHDKTQRPVYGWAGVAPSASFNGAVSTVQPYVQPGAVAAPASAVYPGEPAPAAAP